jgi:hypothetical protein
MRPRPHRSPGGSFAHLFPGVVQWNEHPGSLITLSDRSAHPQEKGPSPLIDVRRPGVDGENKFRRGTHADLAAPIS